MISLGLSFLSVNRDSSHLEYLAGEDMNMKARALHSQKACPRPFSSPASPLEAVGAMLTCEPLGAAHPIHGTYNVTWSFPAHSLQKH